MLLWLTDYVTGGASDIWSAIYLRAFRYGVRTGTMSFNLISSYSLLKLLISQRSHPKPRMSSAFPISYRPHRD